MRRCLCGSASCAPACLLPSFAYAVRYLFIHTKILQGATVSLLCACRTLPFVVAVLQLWQGYLQWSAPYRARYRAAKGRFDAWWEVRTERCVLS